MKINIDTIKHISYPDISSAEMTHMRMSDRESLSPPTTAKLGRFIRAVPALTETISSRKDSFDEKMYNYKIALL